jgi:hypothetical protein
VERSLYNRAVGWISADPTASTLFGAQQAAVERYLNGGNWKVVETFTEVESGRKPPGTGRGRPPFRARWAPMAVGPLFACPPPTVTAIDLHAMPAA